MMYRKQKINNKLCMSTKQKPEAAASNIQVHNLWQPQGVTWYSSFSFLDYPFQMPTGKTNKATYDDYKDGGKRPLTNERSQLTFLCSSVICFNQCLMKNVKSQNQNEKYKQKQKLIQSSFFLSNYYIRKRACTLLL